MILGTVTDAGTASTVQGGDDQPGDDMIKACVERVLEILKEKSER